MAAEANEKSSRTLNAPQRQHLLTSCQYADKLLGEIESILAAATSKSPFPKYKPDISGPQAKVVADYIARIRAQMIRVLASQGIRPREPQFGSIHSIRVTLGFADIAFDECRSENMSGYGEVPESIVPELNGLVDEMRGLVGRLDSYLAQDLGKDLEARLQKLERAGSDLALVRNLERIVQRYGLVEFRPALGNIIDRLESTSFEIAVFGRVSSGKSSLLNRIVQRDVLPVGVTPVTAVPTRIVYGPEERALAWFADRRPERFAAERLMEFVTEQMNPSNSKHVTRIVLEVPSARLRDGVIYVDTPGLGSLATAGAAETLAYLPRCDLGVVLIDAASTLTADDLATIRALYEAAIPAMVLLSKSDLLTVEDRERVRSYVASHITTELGLDLPVYPVSAMPGHAELLEGWFANEIAPLYDRHMELSRQSLNRKIGALRGGVEAALLSRLSTGPERSEKTDGSELRMLETELRKLTGRFSDLRSTGFRVVEEIRRSGVDAIQRAARAVADAWNRDGQSATDVPSTVAAAFEQFGAERAQPLAALLNQVARGCSELLRKAAAGLALENAPDSNEFAGLLKDMPRLDIPVSELDIRYSGFASTLGKGWETRRVARHINAQIGGQVVSGLANFGKRMESWFLHSLSDLHGRFDSYADTYRAQLDRLNSQKRVAPEEEAAMREDLYSIAASSGTEVAESASQVGV